GACGRRPARGRPHDPRRRAEVRARGRRHGPPAGDLAEERRPPGRRALPDEAARYRPDHERLQGRPGGLAAARARDSLDADAEQPVGRGAAGSRSQRGHRRHRLRPVRPRARGRRPEQRPDPARVRALPRHRRRPRLRQAGRADERRPAQPRLRRAARVRGRRGAGDVRRARLRPADGGRPARLDPGRAGGRARGGVRLAQAVHPPRRPCRGGRGSRHRVTRGMIHGRFQPFHNGHLEYLKGAAQRSDEVFVGITNPDPSQVKPEASDPDRHLPESNPYTYVERMLMVKAAAADAGLATERLHVIPFPVNTPELWHAYVPNDVLQYIRLFSDWGGTKLERLQAAGFEVVVLDEGAEKELSGADVRAAIRDGRDWEQLVPPGVAAVIKRLERVPV